MMMRILIILTSLLLATAAVSSPLRIKITEGVVEPLPFAAPSFIAENAAGAEYAEALADIIAQDLIGSGLFREIPEAAHILENYKLCVSGTIFRLESNQRPSADHRHGQWQCNGADHHKVQDL